MKIVIFDLDDALFNTSMELRRILLEEYGFVVDHDGWLNSENTNGHMRDIASAGTYMSTTPLFAELSATLPTEIRRYRHLGGLVGVCTHRGYHPNAQELTHKAFKNYGMEFDFEHYLCPATQSSKLEFLDNLYGRGNYILFDDNPQGDHRVVIDHPYVLLVDRPHNQSVNSLERVSVYQIPNILASLSNLLQKR